MQEVLDVSKIGTMQWYEWLDGQIDMHLETPDDKGFDPFLAGGEEDYENPENHIGYYRLLRQQEKIAILFAQLTH